MCLFRGWFYRLLVTYRSVGQRANYIAKEKKLIDYIDTKNEGKKDIDIDGIIKLALAATAQQLNYTASNNNNDPNNLIDSKTAHCVGYASFFATSCNYLLKKHNLSGNWVATPQIGQLYFLGINVHKYFDSAFFKDHDFVILVNKTTGELLAVDPSVNDYLDIGYVTYRQ